MNKEDKTSFKDNLKVDELKKYQNFFNEKTTELVDEYCVGNSKDARKYMCYLAAALFLTYKEMYPDLCSYIPFRTKSSNSYIRNINKEFRNQLLKFDGSFDEFEQLFNDFKITSDINALTIVLDHINPSKPKKNNYATEEITELYKKGIEAEALVNDLDNSLDTVFLSEKEFYEHKIHILKLLSELSFSEFMPERPMSYEDELNSVEQIYNQKLSENSFYLDATEYQFEDLKMLTDDLRHILYDKYQYLILQETFPKVIQQPIFSHFLKVTSSFGKDARKSNGFAATYYFLETPFGRIEVQLQPSERYFVAKKGSAAHSLLSDKNLNLDELFELANPNDEKPLEYYLEILNKTPVTNIRHDIIKPSFNSIEEEKQFYSSETGKQYRISERLKELQSHIRLKDNVSYKHKIPNTDKFTTSTIPINDIILSLAEFSSPYMNVCSSAHTNFSTASIHHKNLISEFSEVLRRKDSMTCTGDIIIHRLEQIIKNPTLPYQGLPKELSERDIINYARKELHKEDIEYFK